jgi:hypothetical protein
MNGISNPSEEQRPERHNDDDRGQHVGIQGHGGILM